jgi:ribonuclease BN (tRNA processing enzyme)
MIPFDCSGRRYRSRTASLPILVFCAAVGLAVSLPISAAATATSKGTAAKKTTVVLLGTGMPRPNPEASGPATAVVVGSRVFVVDVGPGTERQLAAAKLRINGPTALFITHLHSDHTLGYPDLIFTSWVMGRKKPLPVYGPAGLQKMTDHLLAAYAEDIRIRTEGLEHGSPGGYKVDVHEIHAGPVYDSDGVRVTAIPVLHGNWPEAYAFRFDTPDRSVVISGDTRPCDALIDAAKGVDVLVHEVYPADWATRSSQPPEEKKGWDAYLHQFHTSDVELGTLAAKIQPKLLILTHIVRMKATDEDLLKGVRQGGFQGPTVVGHDLERH